jgi:hypothetical protein
MARECGNYCRPGASKGKKSECYRRKRNSSASRLSGRKPDRLAGTKAVKRFIGSSWSNSIFVFPVPLFDARQAVREAQK